MSGRMASQHPQTRTGTIMRILIATTLTSAALALTGCNVATDPTPVQAASPGKGGPGAAKKKAPPIKLTAKRTAARRSVLSDGGALSCVRVTVTNRTKKNLEVNPLYFSVTDTHGTKHDSSSALVDYEGQIDTTTLAPGENAKGAVCAKGKFVPKVVAMTNPLFDEAARAEVS